jgi:hypothetical protein
LMACRSCGVITRDCDWRKTSLGPIFAPIDIGATLAASRRCKSGYKLKRSPK